MIIKNMFLGVSLLITSLANAADYKVSYGVHDFMVQNIKDDGALGHISPGTSHTFGINAAFMVEHTTKNNIDMFAKAEAFLENNKDELDPDHLPLWLDFLFKMEGQLSKFNNNNEVKWRLFMDNRQNTASSIEREVRQFIGLGLQHNQDNFMVALNAYIGFYYIEIDDDTPRNRGYSRNELDDGESSNLLELKGKYRFDQNISVSLLGRYFNTNTGFEHLEDNVEALFTYDNFLEKDWSLNFKVKYIKYDFDRFNIKEVDMLAWDNDTLIQLSVTMPFSM